MPNWKQWRSCTTVTIQVGALHRKVQFSLACLAIMLQTYRGPAAKALLYNHHLFLVIVEGELPEQDLIRLDLDSRIPSGQ